jgi:osmotically-inducible protein OsmY
MDDVQDVMVAAMAGEGRRGRGALAAKLVLLPIRMLWVGFTAGLKAGWWSAKLPVRASATATRTLGLKAVLLFVAGVAIGVLFAPVRGADLRAKLLRRAQGGGLTDEELAERVGFELAHAPRTWHLPQPEVAVLQGRVELRGSVPHDRGRDELERVAASVQGVASVVNELVVDETEAASN